MLPRNYYNISKGEKEKKSSKKTKRRETTFFVQKNRKLKTAFLNLFEHFVFV
jgi:hypothetical protein